MVYRELEHEIRFLDRRSHKQVAILPPEAFQYMRYTFRSRGTGQGRLDINARALYDVDIMRGAVSGDLEIQAVRKFIDHKGEERRESFIGLIDYFNVRNFAGDSERYHVHFTKNEIVTLGNYKGSGSACREVIRRSAQELRDLHGIHEAFEDERQANTAGAVTKANGRIEEERQAIYLSHVDWGQSEEDTTVQFWLKDPFYYMDMRLVDTAGNEAEFKGGSTAGQYISNLMRAEMINPDIGYRAVDANIDIQENPVGVRLDRAIRWENLGSAVSTALAASGLTQYYWLDRETSRIVFSTRFGRDRSEGQDKIVLSKRDVGQEHDIEPGDIVTTVGYIPGHDKPFAENKQVCVEKEVVIRPTKITVRPNMGRISITDYDLVRSLIERNQNARVG